MFVALFGTLNPGDEVIVADPRYSVYDEVWPWSAPSPSGGDRRVETGFLLDPEAIEAAVTPKTRHSHHLAGSSIRRCATTRDLEAVGEIADATIC